MIMRVLWFSVAPSLKDLAKGGSWIGALKDIVKAYSKGNIELSIAFTTQNAKIGNKVIEDGITYYPIIVRRNYIQRRYVDIYSHKHTDKITLEACKRIIDDSNPDIIHVWGSEWCYGELTTFTDIPVVIHMQGCWPPYRYVGGNVRTQFLNDAILHWYNPHHIFRHLLGMHGSEEREKREEKILKENKYFMGRTRWDEALINLYAPNAQYFVCEEGLRNEFIDCKETWKQHNNQNLRLITVGVNPIKGIREVFTAAKLMTQNSKINFEWRLFGNDSYTIKELEKELNVSCEDINIKYMGSRNASQLVKELLDSDIYVHASHIDNSPNAVCEAQYLGLPIIATNVGGIPSLFDKEYPQDYLVPAWDPYYLASKIKELYSNKVLMYRMSDMNVRISHQRHNPQHIYSQLISIYSEIISCNK